MSTTRLLFRAILAIASVASSSFAVDSEPATTSRADWRGTLAARAGRVPDDASAWVRRGDALMQRSRDAIDPALYADAARAYRAALALDPQHTGAMLGLAWVANSEHAFDDGRRWAGAALAVDPGLPDAYSLLSDAHVELGEYGAALRLCQRALDLRPDLASLSRAAHVLWLTGEPERARDLMARAIRCGGPDAENAAWCRAQLALLHAHGGDLAAAQAVVAEGLRLAPANAHLLAAEGRILAMRGENAAAIAALEASVRRAPTHEALALLHDLHALGGDTGAAARSFDAVLAFHDRHGQAHVHGPGEAEHAHPDVHGSAQLALFLADNDRDLDRALAEAAAAHAAFPNVFSADALAWCLFKAGRLGEARAASREALRWDTPLADLHFHAGMILRASGRPEQAREHLAHALALNRAFHPRDAAVAAAALAGLATGPADVAQSGQR